jgi:Zn ribbon nucleic-acid-binding protein
MRECPRCKAIGLQLKRTYTEDNKVWGEYECWHCGHYEQMFEKYVESEDEK